MSLAAPWTMLAAALAALAVLLILLVRPRSPVDAALPHVQHAHVAGGRVRLGQALPAVPWRFVAALILIVLALGRPQWGQAPVAGPVRHEVVIALDLSRSMLATDDLPSRLERARGIARRFVDESPLADIGLVAFAGRAYLLAAPSADHTLLDTFLPAVHPDQILVPGSDLAAMLDVAMKAFNREATHRTIVLLSDGEAELTQWRPILANARARGIAVVTVGLGTAEGAVIRSADGAEVRTRLNADVLRAIAQETGGAYLDADQAGALAARVDAIRNAAAGRAPAAGAAATAERFGWFILPAVLLLLWSAAREWPARPRLGRLKSRFRPRPPLPAALASVAVVLFVSATAGHAVKPPPDEPDPLREIKQVVGTMVTGRARSADDYLALAQATLAYGEEHRQHVHPLQIGVLMDGVAAVDAGRALDPGRPGWAELRGKLQRLLRPQRTADDPEEGDGEPMGEPDAGDEAPDPDEAGFDPKAKPPDERRVGGTSRPGPEQAEWRVPSLVKPGYILEKLREADQPGDLFRMMQAQEPAAPRKTGQTW